MSYKNLKSQVSSLKHQVIQAVSWDMGLGNWLLGLLLVLSFQGRGNTFTPAALLDSANAAYSKNEFERSSQYYEQIIALGYSSAEVYYNLGNAYYKTDKLGRSILNYERAKKITPFDEDVTFNLKLANQRTLDKIEPAPKLFLNEWWESLKSMHSERTWGIRSILCFALFFFFIGVFIISERTFTKQLGFWMALIFFITTCITFNISRSRYKDITEKNSAVILSSSAEIKNAPTENGTKLFILHEGTVVSTPDSNGAWVKVEISSDKVGWVKRSSLEFI